MKGKDIAGAALIALVLAAGGGLFYAQQSLGRKTYDEATLCPLPEAGGVTAATIVLIDKSDPFAKPSIAPIRASILAARDALPVGGQIRLAVIEKHPASDAAQTRILRVLCNPGSGEAANPIYQNPKHVERRYREQFLAPLDRDLETLLTPGTAPASPIAAALAFALHSGDKTAKRTSVILVSDLLEHTPQASAYDGSFDAAALDRLIPPEARARLDGAQVALKLVRRPEHSARQSKALAAWQTWLTQSGAAVSLEPL